MTRGATYEHVQHSRLIRVLFGAIGIFTLAMLFVPALGSRSMPLGALLTVGVAGIVLLGSGFVFSTLTVRVADGVLAWHFGPGAFRKSVPLANIASAQPTTTSAIDGWGIHYTPRGWLYNVSGRQAVLVTERGGTRFLLGTDEPEKLAAALGGTDPGTDPAAR